MSEEQKLRERVAQLENEFKIRSWLVPDEVDPTLAEDEWWAFFPSLDAVTLSYGTVSKIPWRGGSNMTTTFKVKRVT